MNTIDAKKIVIEVIESLLEEKTELTDDMALIGGGVINSLKLVELCLELEDKADDNGFEFDWTSAVAMSKSQSMFRSVQSLAEEFANQSGN